MSPAFLYEIHGLRLGSALEFPELPRAVSGNPDVELSLAHPGSLGPYSLPEEGEPEADHFQLHERGCDLIWSGDARVRLHGGTKIELEHAEGVEMEALRAAILGPVLGVLLAQRGLLPLHASAIELDGAAITLSGASGEGKSTLAAAMLERGHALLSDDVSAVEWRGDRPWIRRAFPVQKLAPESLAAVGESTAGLAPVHSQETKRLRPVVERFAAGPRPYRAMIVLSSSDRDSLVALSPQDAFLELMRHTYRLGMVQAVLGPAEHLRAVTRLAEAVPVLRLERRRGLDRLGELAETLEVGLRAIGMD